MMIDHAKIDLKVTTEIVIDKLHCVTVQLAINQAILEGEEGEEKEDEEASAIPSVEEETPPVRRRNRPKREVETSSIQ